MKKKLVYALFGVSITPPQSLTLSDTHQRTCNGTNLLILSPKIMLLVNILTFDISNFTFNDHISNSRIVTLGMCSRNYNKKQNITDLDVEISSCRNGWDFNMTIKVFVSVQFFFEGKLLRFCAFGTVSVYSPISGTSRCHRRHLEDWKRTSE